MVTILLIGHGEACSALRRSLLDRGHPVGSEKTGMAGLRSAVESTPDVVLLDRNLPDVDGLKVLSMLRAVSAVPVIVLTAPEDPADIVRALDFGADAALVEPFDIDELEARLRAVLRRTTGDRRQARIRVGGLCIDVAARGVSLDGEEVQLSPKTFDLLVVLARRAGEIVTKGELLADVWRQSHGGCERTVDVHLSWLRRKLGESAADPVYLHSARGVGVRLSAPNAGGARTPRDDVSAVPAGREQPDRM